MQPRLFYPEAWFPYRIEMNLLDSILYIFFRLTRARTWNWRISARVGWWRWTGPCPTRRSARTPTYRTRCWFTTRPPTPPPATCTVSESWCGRCGPGRLRLDRFGILNLPKIVLNENAFQSDAYRPRQWPSCGGGERSACLPRQLAPWTDTRLYTPVDR